MRPIPGHKRARARDLRAENSARGQWAKNQLDGVETAPTCYSSASDLVSVNE
jgi:hypothetical protein